MKNTIFYSLCFLSLSLLIVESANINGDASLQCRICTETVSIYQANPLITMPALLVQVQNWCRTIGAYAVACMDSADQMVPNIWTQLRQPHANPNAICHNSYCGA